MMCRHCGCSEPPYVLEQRARERKEAEKAELLLKRARNIFEILGKVKKHRDFMQEVIVLDNPKILNEALRKAERLEMAINNWFLRNYGDPKESTLVTGEILIDDGYDIPS